MNKNIIRWWILSENIHYNNLSDTLWIKYDTFSEKWWKMNNNKVWAINDKYIWIKNSWIDELEEDLDIHLEALFNILMPLKEKLLSLKEKWCEFQIDIIMYYHQVNPWIYIEEKYSKFIWEMWASINCDIYCLRED